MTEGLRLEVALPSGVIEVDAAWTAATDPRAIAVLAPGAGSGFDHPFLCGLADALGAGGVSTLRFDFPYRAAGRRVPGPVSHATAAWRAACDAAAARAGGLPVVACGKSYGGRMASLASAAGEISPAALVYLGYPLHPPGKPAALRAAHLPDVTAPQLFLSGMTDPFVDPHDDLDDAVRSCRDAMVVWVPGNHSFEVRGNRRSAAEIGAGLAAPVLEWLRTRR